MIRAAGSLERIRAEAARAERSADWEEALALHQRVFWRALEDGDTAVAVDALRGQARACHHRKAFAEAEEFGLLSFEMASRCGHEKSAARALNSLGVVRYLQDDWAEAAALYQVALERALACGDDPLVGWSCQNLGVLASLRGDLREARALYLESVASAVRSGDATTAMTAYNSLGIVSADLEEWTASWMYFERGLELALQLDDFSARTTVLANRAEPLIHLGETERALASLREAEGLALRIADDRALSEVSRFRGLLRRIQQRHEEAEEHFNRAIEIAEGADLNLERAEAVEEIARLRWQQGRPGAARATVREALRLYQSLGAERDAGRIRRTLEEWADPAQQQERTMA